MAKIELLRTSSALSALAEVGAAREMLSLTSFAPPVRRRTNWYIRTLGCGPMRRIFRGTGDGAAIADPSAVHHRPAAPGMSVSPTSSTVEPSENFNGQGDLAAGAVAGAGVKFNCPTA